MGNNTLAKKAQMVAAGKGRAAGGGAGCARPSYGGRENGPLGAGYLRVIDGTHKPDTSGNDKWRLDSEHEGI